MTDPAHDPRLATGSDLDDLARRAGYARRIGEPDAELRHRAFGRYSTVRWELGARVGLYRVLPANERERAALERLGCADFEALSIGREGEGPQVAIIPLDESSREIAQHIIDLHNASVDASGKIVVALTAEQVEEIQAGLSMWRHDRDTGDDWSEVEEINRILEEALQRSKSV